MSRLNPEENHKGLSRPALLDILITAAKKSLGYIFISLSTHDWSEPTKLWRRERSVTYSAVLSGMLQEWISQLEPDWHDVIKCINAGFKGAQQRAKRQRRREKQGRETGMSVSTAKGEDTRCCKEELRSRWGGKVSHKQWEQCVRENSMASSRQSLGLMLRGAGSRDRSWLDHS